MTMWQRDPRVLSRCSGSRRILQLCDAGDVTVVDGTGSVMWDLLADPLQERDLVAALSDAFDVDESTVEAQLCAFLQELRTVGLVQRR